MKTEIKQLKESNDQLLATVSFQQQFLEYLDGEKRASFVIINGISESVDMSANNITAKTDVDKINLVFREIGQADATYQSIQRLGAAPDPNATHPPNGAPRPRPIKITLTDSKKRKPLLEAARGLKSAGPAFENIYIKSDMHPAFRKEMGRLHQSFKTEKEKPENVGVTVVYDPKARVVKVGDTIVDRFQPSSFH